MNLIFLSKNYHEVESNFSFSVFTKEKKIEDKNLFNNKKIYKKIDKINKKIYLDK